jgi:AMP deaminase
MTMSGVTLRDGTGSWSSADGVRDVHLDGHEPRYFPGVVSRGQRKNSKRWDSAPDGDDTTIGRKSSKRDRASSGPGKE